MIWSLRRWADAACGDKSEHDVREVRPVQMRILCPSSSLPNLRKNQTSVICWEMSAHTENSYAIHVHLSSYPVEENQTQDYSQPRRRSSPCRRRIFWPDQGRCLDANPYFVKTSALRPIIGRSGRDRCRLKADETHPGSFTTNK